ncbi:MAG: antA/AntB antirepressor family protein [Clostridium fessum]
MNEMTNIIGMRTPIEIALDIDSEGMTTARKLYDFLGLAQGQFSRWAKANITDNGFATENEDWWGFDIDVEGNVVKDYRLTAHFAKKLSVKGNGEKAEQAREYFTTVEERVKQKAIDRTQLSPNLQALYRLIETQAMQELEQKRQAEQISKVETTVNNMKEIFTQPIGDWKAEINERVREISIKSGIDFQTIYNQMYGELETTAHCSLKRLQENKQKRMEKAGNTKSAIKSETTKIAVVFEKPQLRAIFEGIVKKYAMRYCS